MTFIIFLGVILKNEYTLFIKDISQIKKDIEIFFWMQLSGFFICLPLHYVNRRDIPSEGQ